MNNGCIFPTPGCRSGKIRETGAEMTSVDCTHHGPADFPGTSDTCRVYDSFMAARS